MFKIKKRSLALLLASSAMAMAVQAGQNTTANTVTGRAPVASSVTATNTTSTIPVVIRPIQPRVGHELTAGYGFSDLDGDGEVGTQYQWLRNGSPISGATSSTYTATGAENGTNVSVRVTPRTSAATTDPAVGSPVASSALAVTANAVPIRSFLAPDAVTRDWTGANSYCQGLGARLPTPSELQTLFVDATSATATGQYNSEMCNVYGWPLFGQCGGSSSYYWSSTLVSASIHYGVVMSYGDPNPSSDSNTHLVACIR